jgi:hypothetical protein
MNDAFYGRKAWRGPGKRDRGYRREVGIRVKEARVFGLSRCFARGNEPDVQCLRFDDHARDMALDQLAIRKGGWELRFTHCCKVTADAVAHEGLDLGGRHAGDAACLGLATAAEGSFVQYTMISLSWRRGGLFFNCVCLLQANRVAAIDDASICCWCYVTIRPFAPARPRNRTGPWRGQ